MENKCSEKRISIICACNNEDIYSNMLLPSLQKQSFKNYEIIKLGTKNFGFKSAADALNYGASISSGEILVFVHQDLEFTGDDALYLLSFYCDKYDFGIAGVAGTVAGGKIFSSVLNGPDKEQAGINVDNVTKVDTLDECLLIVKRSEFVDFVNYGSWHFYGVEYSLRMKRDNKSVLVFPIPVYHLSPGWSLDKTYWRTLRMVAQEHRECKVIPTTMGQYANNGFLRFSILIRRIKRRLKKFAKSNVGH